MRLLLATFFIAGCLNLSCEKKVENANVPDHEAGISMEAVLDAHNPAQVFITKSYSIEEKLGSISPEKVEAGLYQDGEKVASLQHLRQNYFGAPYQVQPGEAYTVRVSAPDLPEATGKTRVPDSVSISELTFEDSAERTPNTEVLHAVNFSFEDPPGGETDYYAIEAFVRDTTRDTVTNFKLDLINFDPDVNFEYQKGIYLSDANFNGREKQMTLYVDGVRYDPDFLRGSLRLRIRHISTPLYNYLQSLQEQANSGGTGPFSGQPALTQGNVSNGYGCIGGAYTDFAKLE